jgi:molybdenum cofactor cytidylyltransferase
VRFGSDKRRATGPWEGPLLHQVLALYRPLFDRVGVVIGPDDPFGAETCLKFAAEALINPEAELGMGRSLAVGADWLREGGAACGVIGLGDMPWILPGTIAAIAAEGLRTGRPVAPVYHGEIGFPRALPNSLFPALTTLSGDRGASAVLDWREAHWLDCDDAGILRDIDTPDDIAGGNA